MAAKAWGTPEGAIEEIFFQNDAVSLCLLINRRARTMRVIDFRAGPSTAKRMYVSSLAQREGIAKVYTLVERDEVATWVKLGFAKEGSIPGFYKRSDAFLLGLCVSGRDELPAQSESRIALGTARAPSGGGADDLRDVGESAELDAAHVLAERTVAHAKKEAKDLSEKALPAMKIAPLKEVDAKKAVATAARAGRALTAFEPFGRDVKRSHACVTSRSGFELIVSIESQSCFGNVFLELLTSPRSEGDRLATSSALRSICDKLHAEGVVSCFSLTPSDDVALASAYVANGFRRTGLLKSHVVIADRRRDAIIWSRKIANPADD